MQFIHPQILYFLFLLIIPVLIHLLQLRRFKTELFTNVQFLKNIINKSKKKSKIKKWLLLACRLLLFASLIIAFAQPFLESQNNTTNSKPEIYIILDNSFSMQAKGPQGELLKRAVQELLEETPKKLQFSLLTNSNSFWDTDIESIKGDLKTINYSSTTFQLQNLLSKISYHKKYSKKEIIIISDLVGFSKPILNKNFSKNNLYFIVPKAEKKYNISIDSVFIKQTFSDSYELNVVLSKYGYFENKVTMSVYDQDKPFVKNFVSFDTKNKNVAFRIKKHQFNGYVLIEDASLDYDNTYYFSISEPKKVNILSIGDKEKSRFLSKIYTDDEFNYQNYELTSLEYGKLEKQDLIILNELDNIPPALTTNLKQFEEKGGNIIFIPYENSSIPELNNFLDIITTDLFTVRENGDKMITQINFNHPIYQGVFESKINNFQYPNTKSRFLIKTNLPSILSYEDESPFLISSSKTNGNIYIFTASIGIKNSNFQQSPLIVPTFYKMAKNQQINTLKNITIGTQTPYILDTSLAKEEVLEVRGKQESFIPNQQIIGNKVKLNFEELPVNSGNFKIYKKENHIDDISFNYARTESNIFQNGDSFLSFFEKGGTIKSVLNKLEINQQDNQLWKWFVIFALAFIFIEMLIAKLMK